jgi:hypothetical protein
VFQEATSEPAGKARKPTALHQIPHNKYLGKQGSNHQFSNHKIFNPCKTRSVNFCLSALFICNCIQFYIVICCWFLVRYFICCFVFVVDHSALLFHIQYSFCSFCSLLFCSFNYSIRLLSIIFVLILEMCSRYFDPRYRLSTTI